MEIKVIKVNGEEKQELIFYGETKEDIFNRFYNANRHLRYINDSYFSFADVNDSRDYDSWYSNLNKQTKFDMYYGDGIVD